MSARIADRFHAVVDPVLASWWDDAIWQTQGGNEFHQPIAPDRWLGETLDCLWPGLMPCHLLPLIGNQEGDFLCARIADDGRLGEIVHWFHGGGDWIPWGGNLAEALMVDGWSASLPGLEIRNAESAAVPTPVTPENNHWLHWAAEHFDLDKLTHENVAERFCERGIGSLAIFAGQLVANQMQRQRDRSCAEMNEVPNSDTFAGDEVWCQRAIELNPSLAWAWDTAGRAAEARGDLDKAVTCYTRGARCAAFSSQSVRMGTHQCEDQTPKYSIARLQSIAPEVVRGDDYFRRLTFRTSQDRQKAIHGYWMNMAAASDDGSPSQVFSLHMSAWDIGLWSISQYEQSIGCIAEAAEIGSMFARAEVAKLHLRTIQEFQS